MSTCKNILFRRYIYMISQLRCSENVKFKHVTDAQQPTNEVALCLNQNFRYGEFQYSKNSKYMLYELGLILFQYFQILLCLCCFCCKKKNTDDLKPVKMKSKKSSPYPDDGYPVENLIVTQIPTNSNGAGSSGQPPNYQSIRHNIYIRTVSSQV